MAIGEPAVELKGIDVGEGAKIVWQAWRDNMLGQGRDVPPERMSWETLSQRDKELDQLIYEDVINEYILRLHPYIRPNYPRKRRTP